MMCKLDRSKFQIIDADTLKLCFPTVFILLLGSLENFLWKEQSEHEQRSMLGEGDKYSGCDPSK